MKIRVLSIVAFALLAATKVAQAAETLDGVAAVVNNEAITVAEVRAKTAEAEAKAARELSGNELRTEIAKIRLDVINTLIEQKRAQMKVKKDK